MQPANFKLHIVLLVMVLAIVFLVSHEDSSVYAQSAPAPIVVTQSPLPPAAPIPPVQQTTTSQIIPETINEPSTGKYEYLQITVGCGPYDSGDWCQWSYNGPGRNYDQLYELHIGMLLKIKDTVVRNGETWYHVYFDETLRRPERVQGEWYIPATAGRVVHADGTQLLTANTASTTKRIVVDISDQMLYAYDGNNVFLQTKVSTGSGSTPTPTGTFHVYKKTPTRYMQGPLPGVIPPVPFDLPGVPWNLYFTEGGAVIHGTYWHNAYGTEQSDGCVNLPVQTAKLLYDWADLGTTVTVQN